MSPSPFPPIVRVGMFVFGLAAIASGVNLIRVEWGAERVETASADAPTAAVPEIDMSGLSPAARSEAIKAQIAALQRQLDDARRKQAENARVRAARGNAQAFLQISLALLLIVIAVGLFMARRAAASGAPPRDA